MNINDSFFLGIYKKKTFIIYKKKTFITFMTSTDNMSSNSKPFVNPFASWLIHVLVYICDGECMPLTLYAVILCMLFALNPNYGYSCVM